MAIRFCQLLACLLAHKTEQCKQQITLVGDEGANIRSECVVDGRNDHRVPVTAILDDAVLQTVDGVHANDARLWPLLQTAHQTITKVLHSLQGITIGRPLNVSFAAINTSQTLAII